MAQYHNLSDLKKVSRDLQAKARAAEEERKKALAESRHFDAAAETFRAAMKDLGVAPSPTKGAARTTSRRPVSTTNPTVAKTVAAGTTNPLPNASAQFSDEAEPIDFIESDDGLMFRRPDVSPDIPKKLHRGEWTVQGQVDLHGLFVDEARDAVARLLRSAEIRGERCLRIVHGKGYNSMDGKGVLRELVRRWLQQYPEVMAFVQASPRDGGSGAVILLLEQKRRTRY